MNQVAALVKRIEIKMDSTIAQLSAVHAKMQLMDVKELDSSGARRLQDQIRNEVASLEDMIAAMDDVYSHTGMASATFPPIRAAAQTALPNKPIKLAPKASVGQRVRQSVGQPGRGERP
ncbi:MAG: hypothetical protein HS103_00560 [Anaerolineales bacterium]|nr:hypothetical protein [Anaerolineales bacterium]